MAEINASHYVKLIEVYARFQEGYNEPVYVRAHLMADGKPLPEPQATENIAAMLRDGLVAVDEGKSKV